MGKGLKMFYARHARNEAQRIPVADIRKDDSADLLCGDCKAQISYVPAHTRNERRISAFLRLKKNVEHSSECPNNIDIAIKQVVAQSRDIEHDKSLFDEDDTGYTFRMNVLTDAFFGAIETRKALGNAPNEEEKTRKRVEYQRAEKRLSDYFSSAAGIAKIRANIEESADKEHLSTLVKIDYHGKKISWNDFYYDEDRYPVLFKKAAKIKHPVAISMSVKEAVKLINSEKPFFTLKGDECIVKNEDGSKEYFSPAVNGNTRNLLDNFLPEEEIIVVGLIKIFTNKYKETIIYKNINFWITTENQITRIID